MNFLFALIFSGCFLRPLQAMEPSTSEVSARPKVKLNLKQGMLNVVDAKDGQEYEIQISCEAKKQLVTITKGWQHWFDGWKSKKNSFPLVCLNPDELIDIHSAGLCNLQISADRKGLSILCPLIATLRKKEGSEFKNYDVCIIGIFDENYLSKVHVTPGKITRMKFKVHHSDQDKIYVTSYSRYGDVVAKSRQILGLETLAELEPTKIVALWKKLQSPSAVPE